MMTTVYSDSLDGLIKEQSLLFGLGYIPNSKIKRFDNVFYRDFVIQEKKNDIVCCLIVNYEKEVYFTPFKNFRVYKKSFKYPYRIYFKLSEKTKEMDVIDFVLDELYYMRNADDIDFKEDDARLGISSLLKKLRARDQGSSLIESNRKFLKFITNSKIKISFFKFKL